MSDVGTGSTGLVTGLAAFHNSRRPQIFADWWQLCSYQKFLKIWRTFLSYQGAVGEDLGQPRIISNHHPVMFSDDVGDRGEAGVIGHSKHRFDVTLFSHYSFESFGAGDG